MELRHLVEVEVVGDDNAVERLREFEELEVNLLDGGEVRVNDLDVERGVRLQAVEHVEAAAAPLAFGRVGRVGHLLKLAEDELRDDDCAGEEAGLGHVGDAPVNDDGGVENLHVLARQLVAEDAAQGRQVEVVALGRADHQADVGHDEGQGEGQEGFRRGVDCARLLVADEEPDQHAAHDAHDRADASADQSLQGGALDAYLEEDDGDGDDEGEQRGEDVRRESEGRVGRLRRVLRANRVEHEPRPDQDSDEDKSYENRVRPHDARILTRW